MKLHYHVSAKELREFRLHQLRAAPEIRSRAAVLRLLITFGVFYGVLGLLSQVGDSRDGQTLAAFIFALACFFATPGLLRLGQRTSAQRYATDQWRQIGMHELEVLPEALFGRAPAGESHYAWSHLARIESNPLGTGIHLDSQTVLIIPAGSVREGDYAAFVRALRARFDATLRAAAPAPPRVVMLTPREQFSLYGSLALLLLGMVLGAWALSYVAGQLGQTPPAPMHWSWVSSQLCFVGSFAGIFSSRQAAVRLAPGTRRNTVFLAIFSAVFLAFALGSLGICIDQGWQTLREGLPAVLFGGAMGWFLWEAIRIEHLLAGQPSADLTDRASPAPSP